MPHPADAKANPATPSRKIRRRPNRSPSAPPTSSREERKRAYASTTHCTSATVAPSCAWRAGSATFTAVPSMNAMLEPRMVAASTQGSAAPRHGDPALPERATPSSQGVRTCKDPSSVVSAPGSAELLLKLFQEARLPLQDLSLRDIHREPSGPIHFRELLH